MLYKTTDFWSRECESAIRWDDPRLGIAWPVVHDVDGDQIPASLSQKDAVAPLIDELSAAEAFR